MDVPDIEGISEGRSIKCEKLGLLGNRKLIFPSTIKIFIIMPYFLLYNWSVFNIY